MYLFFDTETNGLPKNYKASSEYTNNWPRVIQLAYAVFDKDQKLIKQFCELIRPDGWTIPKEKFWIDNGYTTERNTELGVDMKLALAGFIEEREKATYAIAHNINFDAPILRAEMFRYNIKNEFTAQKICTMMAGTNICQIPGPYGFKWPKLEELHRHLFKTDFEGAHDALNDVMACAKCFFEMQRLELITYK